jgi:hypothetical protein
MIPLTVIPLSGSYCISFKMFQNQVGLRDLYIYKQNEILGQSQFCQKACFLNENKSINLNFFVFNCLKDIFSHLTFPNKSVKVNELPRRSIITGPEDKKDN